MQPDQSASSPFGASERRVLTSQRTLVWDVSELARGVPLFPVERTFDLSQVAAHRAAAYPKIAWSVLFMKAYALVAAKRPELRRAFMRWPRPHFVEAPASIGVIAVHREHGGRDRLCWASFQRPEERKLIELNGHLRWYQTQPVTEAFHRQVQFSRLPLLVRRLIWWWNLNVAGGKRAERLGTFSISSLAGQHALNRGHPTVLTTSLTYGPLDENGRSIVTLLCDHRVLDGVPAAAALDELQMVLRGEICRELASLAVKKAA